MRHNRDKPNHGEKTVCVSHPMGNENCRALVKAMDQSGMLACFHTCIGAGYDAKSSLWKRFCGPRCCEIKDERIMLHPTRELLRLLTRNQKWARPLQRHERGWLCIDQVCHSLDAKVAAQIRRSRQKPTALYAYEDCALQSFQAAREAGIRTFYDLPIGYWRRARAIQVEEADRLPEWRATMPALIDSEEKLNRKDAEIAAAGSIFVASSFTADTLNDLPFESPTPLVVPYGCPTVATRSQASRRTKGRLKILFVGGLSQRKGLSYLLEAVHQFDSYCDLTFIGRRVADCRPLDEALKKHQWIESLPHHRILEEMLAHDVLVFPSLFEGFGLVVTEALSRGLPVIATSHTCAPDILTDGEDGFIVPIRDSEAIADKLEILIRDRSRLLEMSQRALQTASLNSWSKYGSAMIQAIAESL